MYRLTITYYSGETESLWYGTSESERLLMNAAYAVGGTVKFLGITQTLSFHEIDLKTLVSA